MEINLTSDIEVQEYPIQKAIPTYEHKIEIKEVLNVGNETSIGLAVNL
jgi:hypothetical protein